jgi:hypothetical protein
MERKRGEVDLLDMVHIPKYMKERAHDWAFKVLGEKAYKAAIEEDCAVSPPFSFEIFTSGLGETVYAKMGSLRSEPLNPEEIDLA